MTDADGYPSFDEEDRAIFAIEDSRSRADTMRDALVPKLCQIVGIALAMIKDTYRIDPLASSTETTSPEHRANAAKTKTFHNAFAGLVKRQIAGKYYYLKLVFILSESGLLSSVEAFRPVDPMRSLVFFAIIKLRYCNFSVISDSTFGQTKSTQVM